MDDSSLLLTRFRFADIERGDCGRSSWGCGLNRPFGDMATSVIVLEDMESAICWGKGAFANRDAIAKV